MIVLSLLCATGASAAKENPIRKVVRLMQDMSAEIESEKKKEAELYEKFMCVCSEYPPELKVSAESAAKAIADLGSKIEEETAQKAKLAEELKGHAADKDAAEKDLAKATTLRGKEAAEYESSVADLSGNIAQLASAIPALEKGGAASSLMQSDTGSHLKNIISTSTEVSDFDKKQVLAFLGEGSDASDSTASSGEVLGILKQMKDDMEKRLEETEASEKIAVTGFADLKGAKDEEIELAAEAIEAKEKHSGELALSVAQNSDALEDAQGEKADAEKMLATLSTTCVSKKKDFEVRLKLRNDEIAAISEAVSILNDDDALDVFKKAIPSALMEEPAKSESGFLQTKHAVTASLKMNKALDIIRQASKAHHDVHLALLLSKMTSKVRSVSRGTQAPDFGAVMKMVDDMLGVLTKEQEEDASKKEWCLTELAKAEKVMGAKQEAIDSVSAALSQVTDEITGLEEDITALQTSISELNKEVATATETRKAEHVEYGSSLQMTEAAIVLIGKAKNRLMKFYNPTIYKAPPKKEITMEEKIVASYSFVQKHAFSQKRQMPDIPELEPLKPKNSGGVVALMDGLVVDLEKDKTGTEADEKAAQKAYVSLMADSQASIQQDTKSLVNKGAAKAELEKKRVEIKETKTVTFAELNNAHTFLGDLHATCDFVVENFSMRETARAAEIESLKSAKNVLAGATL